jgi:hypothetical protein
MWIGFELFALIYIFLLLVWTHLHLMGYTLMVLNEFEFQVSTCIFVLTILGHKMIIVWGIRFKALYMLDFTINI